MREPLKPGDPRHGTAGGYNNHGCRCDACREGRRLWRTQANPIGPILPTPRRSSIPSIDDNVEALCWCQRARVVVPVTLVRECRTGSCGQRGCEEMVS